MVLRAVEGTSPSRASGGFETTTSVARERRRGLVRPGGKRCFAMRERTGDGMELLRLDPAVDARSHGLRSSKSDWSCRLTSLLFGVLFLFAASAEAEQNAKQQ